MLSFRTIAALGLMLATPAAAAAKDLYVDAARGADERQCLSKPSPEAPCKTISYVLKKGIGGDVVHVRAGTYFEKLDLDEGQGGSESKRTRLLADGGVVTLTGLDPIALDDTKFVPCTAAANCAGDGQAFPRTYRIEATGRGDVQGVYELKWKPLRIDDKGVTDVVFDFTEPMQYKQKRSLAAVESLPGSFLVQGGNLFVHTFFDEDPRSGKLDLETRIRTGVGVTITGSYIDLVGFDLRYFESGLQLSGDSIQLDRMRVISGSGIGVELTPSSSDCRITNTEVSHIYRRKADDDSWVNKAGGTGFSVKGSHHTLVTITAWNCWNLFSGTMTDTLVEDAFVKNTPNHTFIMANTPGEDDCRDNVVKRSTAFNGQDQFFIRGCHHVLFLRNQGGVFLDDGARSKNRDSTHWKVRGNNAVAIYVGEASASGLTSDYNWLDERGTKCRRAKDARPCATGWRELGYDAHSTFRAVKMAGAEWPLKNGFDASTRWRSDFFSKPGSALIDAGDPDLDGDGVLETAPGGDDECTPAHFCSGGKPDLGPHEYGL